MITKEIYVRDFSEYIDLTKSEKQEFEDIFSFVKDSSYLLDRDKKQETIIDELNAWKKFNINSRRRKDYLKVSFRDFEPILTQGEIAEFIYSKLEFFDNKTGEFIGYEAALEKILRRQLNAIQQTRDVYSAFLKLEKTYYDIKKLTGINVFNFDINEYKTFVLNAGNRLNALELRNIFQSSIPKDFYNNLKTNLNKQSFVDFIFDSITDYDLYNVEDRKFGSVREQLEFRFNEFIKRGLFKTDEVRGLTSNDIFDVAIRMFDSIKNDFIKTKSVFKFNFTNSLVKAINKEMSALDFNKNVRSMLRSYGRQAFRAGILEVGLDPLDFRPIENFLIRKMNTYVNYYITNLTTKVLSNGIDVAKAMVTGDSWANRTVSRFFEYGRLAADRNGLYEWVYGDTKHCKSCLRAHEQRHRLRHWYEAGILPQNNGHKNIICGGYHCECKLKKVSGKSRGRLDRIPLKSGV